MQGRPPPEPRLPRSLPGAAGDTGRGPFRRGPGRPATQRAGRAEPTPLSLHTGTHRDIIRAHMRAPCAVAAMTARGHGNDGESPGNTCHMTTGRGVLYQFF
jgi:hypothetical protein